MSECIKGYDDWKTALPDEPEPVAKCSCCECNLYEGDYLYMVDGDYLCEDCLNDQYRRML